MPAGGGMVALQSDIPMTREVQAQMVQVPDSGGVSNQPSVAIATGCQPQQKEMGPTFGQGQLLALENEQVRMKQLDPKRI